MERRSASGTSRTPAARSRSRPSASASASPGSTATSSTGRRTSWCSRRPRPSTFTPERIAQGRKLLHERYGMPMAWTPLPPLAATIDACRAVVAARLRSEQQCGALLRRLRVLAFSGLALDDPDVIARAATEAGMDPAALAGWMEENEVERGAARRHARRPLPRRPPRARRTTSWAGRRRSAVTPARATSSSAPRPRARTGTPPIASTCPGSARSRPTRPRWPTSRPSSRAGPTRRRSARCSHGPGCRSPPPRSPRSATARSPTSARSSRTSPPSTPVGGDGYWTGL